MKTLRTAWTLTLLSIAATTVAVAQTQPSQGNGTSPSSASSPHQRAATSNGAPEAPATNGTAPSSASTPHQQQATHGKMANSKAMKDCMAKEKAKNSSASQAEMKKTCTDQMKSSSAPSNNH
jgi:hypothetical protein